MPFMLRDVGLECFTLVFQGEDIGAVFCTDEDEAQPWIAILHTDCFRSTSKFPHPFTTSSHRFTVLHDLRDWLGIREPTISATEMAA